MALLTQIVLPATFRDSALGFQIEDQNLGVLFRSIKEAVVREIHREMVEIAFF